MLKPPAALISSVSDSPSGLDFHQACLTTVVDEKSPMNPGDYRIDPPNYAASCPDPTSDPQGLQRFAANFLHPIKIKRYFTIYHYVGDKYGATGYLGTGPIGWGVAAVLTTAGAAAATVTPTPSTPNIHNGDYIQYCKDIDLMRHYPFGYPANYLHVLTKSNKVGFNDLWLQSVYVQKQYPGDYGLHDIYFHPTAPGATMTFTGESSVTSRVDHYTGDGYGSQGYTGQVKKDLTVYQGSTPCFQWTYTGP